MINLFILIFPSLSTSNDQKLLITTRIQKENEKCLYLSTLLSHINMEYLVSYHSYVSICRDMNYFTRFCCLLFGLIKIHSLF